MKKGFIERTIANLMAASDYAANAEQIASAKGVLQHVDPRVKVVGLFALVLVTAASKALEVIGAVFALSLALALLSCIRFRRMMAWFWIPVLFFTGMIALPAIFLTPGRTIATLGPLVVTREGVRSALFLVCRAETAATLSALLVLTTPWPWVLKALRTLKCPVVLVTILGMTYRYIFVILQSAFEMFESRKSRTVGILERPERQRLAAAAVGVLLSKAIQLSGDVHLAMLSRGFRGEVYLMQEFRAKTADWYWLAGFAAAASAGLWWGK